MSPSCRLDCASTATRFPPDRRRNRPRPTLRVREVVLALTPLLAAFASTDAQPPEAPTRVLERWTRVSQEPFETVAGVRELPDGRVLVADRAEGQLIVLDRTSGEHRAITRAGDGPGELRGVDRLLALRGDTSLAVHEFGRRWLLLAGVRVVATSTASARGRVPPLRIEGADTLGRLLSIRLSGFRRSPGIPYTESRSNAESLLVLLRPRGSARDMLPDARVDTVARLRGRAQGQVLARREKPPPASLWLLESPLAAEEQSLLFRDGWLAVARAAPYRVEWRAPDGARVRGPVLPFERIVVDPEMRRAISRAHWPTVEPPFAPAELPDWPATLPPFLNDALVEMPDGRLAIRRAGDPRRPRAHYDVIDRAGEVRARIEVPARIVLVGWGLTGVYGVETDEDLAQWLVWHPWTAALPARSRGSRMGPPPVALDTW